MKARYLPLMLFFVLTCATAIAQGQTSFSCPTDIMHENRLANDSKYAERVQQMEQQIYHRTLNVLKNENDIQFRGPSDNCQAGETLYTIPVVVHVVHRSGIPIGTDENLSDADINDVIIELNDRFAHASGLTFDNPFHGVNVGIELCLATRRPDGTATTGIERYADNANSENNSDTYNTQNTYHWSTTDYMNIYVVNSIVGSSSGAAGYSTLAGSHGNPGDGIVMLYSSWWSGLLAHEAGHYFNLRHNFLNGCTNNNCLTDGDFVCDTPPKANSGFTGTPCASPGNSCTTDDDDTNTNNPYRPVGMGGLGDVNDPLENYMDYTGSCWEAYSEGQKVRMRASIQQVRSSLLNSVACQPFVANDVGITTVVYPFDQACESTFAPIVALKNYGTSTLTSAAINIEIDGVFQYTYNWAGSLAPDASENVTLPTVTVATGPHTIYASAQDPNGLLDPYTNNNDWCGEFTYYAAESSFPYCYNAETSIPTEWTVSNPDNFVAIETFSLGTCASNGSNVLAYNSFEINASATGTSDAISTNVLDLTGYSNITLSFDRAYVQTFSNRTTILDVSVSADCGQTFNSVYNATGSTLATIGGFITTNWQPSSCSDWATTTLDLSAYANSQIIIRFEIIIPEWWGQNIFLDNICVEGELGCSPPAPNIDQSNVLLCGTDATLTASAIPPTFGGYTHQWYLDGVLIWGANSQTYNASSSGQYQVLITNGTCPSALSAATTVTSLLTQPTPYTQDFSSGIVPPTTWNISNPDSDISWEWGNTNCYGGAATINNYLYDTGDGQSDFLNTPLINLSSASTASLIFDLAYAQYSASFSDGLNINISIDCGQSFTNIYSKSGTDLATAPDNTNSFVPTDCSEWRTEVVDISAYTDNDVIIQFENISGYGNNLYIDNVNINAVTTVPENRLYANVWLEGAYDVSSNTMNTTLNSNDDLPTTQPYNAVPWFYTGTESVSSMPTNITDWVLVKLYDSATSALQETKAALLRNDGVLLDVDGNEGVIFTTTNLWSNYFIVIEHRNHIGLKSNTAILLPNALTPYDFTVAANVQNSNSQTSLLEVGVVGMIAGDMQADNVINYADFNNYYNSQGQVLPYLNADCNLDGLINDDDFNLFLQNVGEIGIIEVR